MLIDEINDHSFDEAAVKSQDAFVTTSSGIKRRRQTTQGFSLCIKCRNGNTTWVALKDIREAYPVQLVEYSVAANISMEANFSWWVPNTLNKRNRII